MRSLTQCDYDPVDCHDQKRLSHDSILENVRQAYLTTGVSLFLHADHILALLQSSQCGFQPGPGPVRQRPLVPPGYLVDSVPQLLGLPLPQVA